MADRDAVYDALGKLVMMSMAADSRTTVIPLNLAGEIMDILNEPVWHNAKAELPKGKDPFREVLVTTIDKRGKKRVGTACHDKDGWHTSIITMNDLWNEPEVLAWMELPEPASDFQKEGETG